MELLKLCKFKLQLRTLITEFRELREREKSSTEQLNLLIQKQKQTELEFGTKLQELQSELASSNEMRQKLERKVSYLQNENDLLEIKQKDLKGTMDSLLMSRESFENAYQDSTWEMKRAIEIRDRKITLLSEKINSHLALFESIEKEAFSVNQVVDNVQRLVSEKENVVAGLKSKMDNVSTLETAFAEKTLDLETRLQKYGDELRRKDKNISELEAQVEALKISSNRQPQIEELQRTLSAKELIIENLISEKKALHLEVGSLGFILQKIKDTVTVMNEEDKGEFSSILESQGLVKNKTEDDNRLEDAVQRRRENPPSKVYDSAVGIPESTVSPQCHDQNSVSNHLQENNNFSSSVADSTCMDPQLAAHALSISVNEVKDDFMAPENQLDSECSTTQTEATEHPG